MKNKGRWTDQIIESIAHSEFLRKPVHRYAVCGFLCVIVLVFLYMPSLTRLDQAKEKWSEVKIELQHQRSIVSESQRLENKLKAVPKKDVPLAIADLTRRGRELGLDFSSISPGQLQETTQAGVETLPITFAIRSPYQNVGEFMAFIEKYSSSIVAVESFVIHAHEKALSTLSIDLVLNLYVDIEDAT